MKAQCHRQLAEHLIGYYMAHLPRSYNKAFYIGCVEPDKNPGTYLKGSIKKQWLCGHNWENAKNHIRRMSNNIERKRKLTILDYYRLGKLIHYIADGFTHVHNTRFQKKLRYHRSYEAKQQEIFDQYLESCFVPHLNGFGSISDMIALQHRRYLRAPVGIHTDAQYCMYTCHIVMSMLLHCRKH